MTDPQIPRPRRIRATVIGAVAIAAGAAATATLLLTSGSPARPPTAARAARDRAIATGHALNVGHGSAQVVRRPQLRLGLLATPAGATGLAGVKLGYIAVQLGASATELTPKPYASPAEEESALASGRLDAAYLPPVQAILAWQATSGRVRIIAGANSNGITTVAVLVVTTAYLTAHPTQVQELLKGHIQAATTLITDPGAGHAAVTAELHCTHRRQDHHPPRCLRGRAHPRHLRPRRRLDHRASRKSRRNRTTRASHEPVRDLRPRHTQPAAPSRRTSRSPSLTRTTPSGAPSQNRVEQRRNERASIEFLTASLRFSGDSTICHDQGLWSANAGLYQA